MSEYTDAAQFRYDLIAALLARDFPPPARIVELGSSPGHQIAALARRGYEATSIDLGEAEWGGGPGEFEETLRGAGVRHVEWDLERVPLPFRAAEFEAALMTEVVEHLRDYPARTLCDVHRILQPGGRLYLTTPNSTYVVNRLRLLAGRSVYTPLPDWIGGLPHARHAREYTVSEVRDLLGHAGFEVVALKGRHLYLESGRGTLAARLGKTAVDRLSRVWPTLGPSIVAVAEKPATAE